MNRIIHTLHALQLRSFGILPVLPENSTKTAAQTLITAFGGMPNDFNSVKLFLLSVLSASLAATSDGSALRKSASHIFALIDTSSSITRTFFSSSAAVMVKRI